MKSCSSDCYLITHMFLPTVMCLVYVGVEVLIPSSTQGAHLLLVQVGSIVVNGGFLLGSKHLGTTFILARFWQIFAIYRICHLETCFCRIEISMTSLTVYFCHDHESTEFLLVSCCSQKHWK